MGRCKEVRVSQPDRGRRRDVCMKRAALRVQQEEPFQALKAEDTGQEGSLKGCSPQWPPQKKHLAAPYKKFSFASCVEFPILVRNINTSLMWKQGQARSFKDRDQRNSRLKDSS